MTDNTRKESQALLYKAWLRYTLYCGAAGGAFGLLSIGLSGIAFRNNQISSISYWIMLLFSDVFYDLRDRFSSTPLETTVNYLTIVISYVFVATVAGCALSPLYMGIRYTCLKSYRAKFLVK